VYALLSNKASIIKKNKEEKNTRSLV
jgi:hypothetical protein